MKDVYRTSTGIEIGCMYQRPLPRLNEDEEQIQRALLGIRRPNYFAMALYVIFLCGLTTMLAMTIGSGR